MNIINKAHQCGQRVVAAYRERARKGALEAAATSAAQRASQNVAAIAALLCVVGVAIPDVAYAQQAFNFGGVDRLLCSFLAFAKSKLAPLIAVAVIILSIIGHWLGAGKMWGQILYVGIGMGVIMGIASLFASFGGGAGMCPGL
jgi:hypothetical protein